MTVVCDTSPITNLLTIGRLDLLEKVHPSIVIPFSVREELSVVHPEFSTIPLPSDFAWIKVQAANPAYLAQVLPYDLGPGESEALALSLELPASLIVLYWMN